MTLGLRVSVLPVYYIIPDMLGLGCTTSVLRSGFHGTRGWANSTKFAVGLVGIGSLELYNISDELSFLKGQVNAQRGEQVCLNS